MMRLLVIVAMLLAINSAVQGTLVVIGGQPLGMIGVLIGVACMVVNIRTWRCWRRHEHEWRELQLAWSDRA